MIVYIFALIAHVSSVILIGDTNTVDVKNITDDEESISITLNEQVT